MKLDLPEPLGPMRTFSGSMGRSIPCGPKDSIPLIVSRRMSMLPAPLFESGVDAGSVDVAGVDTALS